MKTNPTKNNLLTRRCTALVGELHVVSILLLPLLDALLDGGPRWRVGVLPVVGPVNLSVVAPLAFGAWLMLRDSLFGGTSIGKRLVGLRVVRPGTDAAPAPWSATLRNVPLALPLLGWLVELLVAQRNPQKRRLGDRLADTQVREANPALATLPWLGIFIGVYLGGSALRRVIEPPFTAWLHANV